MTTRIIREPWHISALVRLLEKRKLPVIVTITQGEPRSDQQNRLSHRWYADIARDLGDVTPEEARAACKLHHGIPILCENEGMRDSYDRALGPLLYADKLRFIERFQLPVTSLMGVKQMSRYMDAVQAEYLPQGVRLTDPVALKYECEFLQS